MKPVLQTSIQIPWQAERANLLHRACNSLLALIQSGQPVRKALARVARRYNGRAFKCEPSRKLQLSAITLRRAWNAWRRGGQLPSAIRLNYQQGGTSIAAPVLVRFANFCASQPHSSLRSAWDKFMARRGSFGFGRRPRQPRKISYRQLCRYFSAADFRQMQSHLKAIEAEQFNLAQIRLKVIADIRRRLPDQLPARRVKRELTFEI